MRTLRAYLDLWKPCVEVIAATPLHQESVPVRDTYLFRVLSEMTEGVRGFDITSASAKEADMELMYVLYWMDVLDKLWAARFHQRHVSLREIQDESKATFPTPTEASRVPEVLASATSLGSPVSEAEADPPASVPKYSVTDSIRLRDEMLDAKEQLFGWMRDQLGVPRPPVMEDAWTESLRAMDEPENVPPNEMSTERPLAEPALTMPREEKEEDEEEETVMETSTDRHYAQLFKHKLDPDASDEEEDEAAEEEAPPMKRAKATDKTHLAFWDTHFASLFARSLHHLRPDAV